MHSSESCHYFWMTFCKNSIRISCQIIFVSNREQVPLNSSPLTYNDYFPEYGIFTLSQVIQHHTDLMVSKFHDDEGDQYEWSPSRWHQHLQGHHIIVMPPRLFSHLLQTRAVTTSQMNLVILDDCHLILQEHPYAEIMDHFRKPTDTVTKGSFPRILGLTSCFTSKKCRDPKELEVVITSLEKLLSAKAETATLVISERFGIRPKEEIIECENYVDSTGTFVLLENILCSALDFLHDCKAVAEESEDSSPCSIPITALTECLNILYVLGPWCASCIANMLVNQIEKVDKHETVALHKKFLHFSSTQLRMISTLFDANFSPNYDVEELLLYTTPKVYELVSHLRKYRPECDFMIVSSADGELDGMMGLGGDSDSDLSDDSDFSEDEGNAKERSENRNVIHIAIKKDQSEENAVDPMSSETEKYLCGIVFVEDRNVALVLNKFLEEVFAWDETLCFVKSHHITGICMHLSLNNFLSK